MILLSYEHDKVLKIKQMELVEGVDVRSRMLAFRGACGEPPRLFKSAGVSPVPLIPQDKEGINSDTSHEENVIFHFRGVSHLALQSTAKEVSSEKSSNLLLIVKLEDTKNLHEFKTCAGFYVVVFYLICSIYPYRGTVTIESPYGPSFLRKR
jgi:hypothetical protein